MSEELNIGDYVRTKYGIAKIKSFELKNKEIINLDKDIMFCNMDIYRNCCTINQVIKSSPNIIDLIEVGDYINRYLVTDVYKPDGNEVFRIEIERDTLKGHIIDKSSQIKSIVTHEMFESMEYKIGDKDE